MIDDLFTYPHSPGFKEPTTSKEAAESMKPTARLLRGKVLRVLAQSPCTPDQCAAHLGESVLSIRPRFTELAADEKIVETGERRKNTSGRSAKVYRLA